MSLVDSNGRPISSAAQAVITIVLEGRTLNFGANMRLLSTFPRETKIKIFKAIETLLFPERPV